MVPEVPVRCSRLADPGAESRPEACRPLEHVGGDVGGSMWVQVVAGKAISISDVPSISNC